MYMLLSPFVSLILGLQLATQALIMNTAPEVKSHSHGEIVQKDPPLGLSSFPTHSKCRAAVL